MTNSPCDPDAWFSEGKPDGLSVADSASRRIVRHGQGAAGTGDATGNQFRDGSSEGLGELAWKFASLPPNPTGDAFVDAWVEVSSRPDQILSSLWRVAGDASLITNTPSASIRLAQTTNTSITQLLQLLSGRKTVEFDLRTVAAGVSDTLQVIVGEKVAGEIPLTATGEFRRQTVRLDSFSDWNSVGFRLAGPEAVPAEVWLDNVAIIYEPPHIQRAERLPDGRLKLMIETGAGASFALDTSRDLQNWTEHTIITVTQNEVEHLEEVQAGVSALFYQLRPVSGEAGAQ